MCYYIIKNGIDQNCDGFLRHSYVKFGQKNGVLIHMVVITPDAGSARRAKFDCFCGWANAAIMSVTQHCCSSPDEPSSKKKKSKLNNLENNSIFIIQLLNQSNFYFIHQIKVIEFFLFLLPS